MNLCPEVSAPCVTIRFTEDARDKDRDLVGTPAPDLAALPPSPVPSDQRLGPGELPFTAFGQLGVYMLDLRVFDQDRWWVDRAGRPHDIAQDMSREYVDKVIAFLIERQEQHFVDSALRAAVQTLGDQLLFAEPGPSS